MKFKKFLASVLSVLMLASSMSYAAYAQESTEESGGTETVTITFNSQNGAFKKETVGEVKNKWVSYAVSTAEVAVGETVTFPEPLEYKYHGFKGWSTEIGGEVIDTSAVTATADATYYGVWEWTKADDGTPLDSKFANTKANQMSGEGSTKVGQFYDAVADTVYVRFQPKTAGKTGSCNMYNGINYTVPGNELYMTALIRSSITGSKPTAGIYNSSDKSGASKSQSALTALEATTAEDADKWNTVIFKSTLNDFGVGTHIDFDAAGADTGVTLDDYYDVAGIALFATLKDAEAYAITSYAGYTGDAVIKFDAQLTADDDTDVYTEYPTNLENDGNALVGWTLDPNAETIEYVDLTALAVPTEEVTYYAVWNEERTINFYKNDGTDAVETLTLGKGAAVEAPEFVADGKYFLGWSETANGELVEVQATAEESKDYYAIWLNDWLTAVVVNGNDYNSDYTNGKWYGIEDLATADKLDFVMPYGYPTSIVPTIVPTAANSEAVYNAPETFDGEGSIVMGDITLPVTFTVADRSTVENIVQYPQSSVDGCMDAATNSDHGIEARMFTPKYGEDKGTGVEGWGIKTHNMESYDQYRILVYYDDGGDGADIDIGTPGIYVSNAHTRGTLRNKAIYANSGVLLRNRWEYVYFNLPEDTYGITMQLTYHFFNSSKATNIKNDKIYVAKVEALVDADEAFLQYTPVGLSSTNETSAKNDGIITGVSADMEIAIGDGEYAAVTTFAGYNAETGVISGLAPATYSVRYAATETHAASEAVELTVEPDSVEIYFEDGDETTEVVTQVYAYNASVAAPETNPAKLGYKFAGWALEDAETAYDFADAVATAELDGATFNALWERINVVYVDGTVEASGDGFTADSAVKTLKEAIALVADINATVVVAGDVILSKSEANGVLNGGNITITGLDGETNTNAALINESWCVPFGGSGSLMFENITLKSSYNWGFIDFAGLDVEFGENVTVPTGEIDGEDYYQIRAHAAGESGVNYTDADGNTYIPVGDKIVIKSGNIALHLGGKGKGIIEPIDFELLGGTAEITLGNDSINGKTLDEVGGTLSDVKLLLDVAPSLLTLGWVTDITGSYQFIANNGVETEPVFSNKNIENGRITLDAPEGTWIIHSAEGGRVDFTETAGTFKVTTDKTYAVITDADGNSTKYRMADGVSGEANLYADEVTLNVTLPAGDYSVDYTDMGVYVNGVFDAGVGFMPFQLSADNNYTATVSDDIIQAASENAPAGYKFSGEFASADGKYKTVDGVLTVTEYTEEELVLSPVYVEDDTLPYYHATGLYNDKLGTYDVTVSIANGEFTAGTVGGTFNKAVLEYTGYTLGDGISNNLGDAPDIVKDSMYDGEDNKFVLVWDATAGSIDATEADVEIITFHYNVLDAETLVGMYNDLGVSPVAFYHPETVYEEYFDGEYYQASPVLGEGDDQFAVNYVDVYEGKVGFEYAPTDPATITVKVNMPDKAGKTTDDIAYLAYTKAGIYEWNFIALEEAGNKGNIEKVISDVFFVGETYTFTIAKNGYTGSETKTITLADGMTFEATILGGDIKESFTGEDPDAVDSGDFGDGDVTLADFVRVVRAFDEATTEAYEAVVDINEDGIVNVTDISIVKDNYGASYSDVEIIVTTASADGE